MGGGADAYVFLGCSITYGFGVSVAFFGLGFWAAILVAVLCAVVFALILGIHRLMAEGLVPTNLIGNAVATIVVSKWESSLDEKQLEEELNRKDD